MNIPFEIIGNTVKSGPNDTEPNDEEIDEIVEDLDEDSDDADDRDMIREFKIDLRGSDATATDLFEKVVDKMNQCFDDMIIEYNRVFDDKEKDNEDNNSSMTGENPK